MANELYGSIMRGGVCYGGVGDPAVINQVSDNIAPKQETSTASKLITTGEYFVNADGDLCQCDVQIASGGTIIVGSNCHVINAGGINYLNGNVVARGKMLGCIELPAYTYSNADDLPEGYAQFSRASEVSNLPTNVSPTGGELFCMWGYRRFQLFIDWEGLTLWFRGYNASTSSFNPWGRFTTSAT